MSNLNLNVPSVHCSHTLMQQHSKMTTSTMQLNYVTNNSGVKKHTPVHTRALNPVHLQITHTRHMTRLHATTPVSLLCPPNTESLLSLLHRCAQEEPQATQSVPQREQGSEWQPTFQCFHRNNFPVVVLRADSVGDGFEHPSKLTFTCDQ